jgi:carboxypeptidase family protein
VVNADSKPKMVWPVVLAEKRLNAGVLVSSANCLGVKCSRSGGSSGKTYSPCGSPCLVCLALIRPGRSASLNGTVTDASGAVIPRANVVVVAPVTGLHRETATGTNGSYNIPGLPIGTYNVTVLSQALKQWKPRG